MLRYAVFEGGPGIQSNGALTVEYDGHIDEEGFVLDRQLMIRWLHAATLRTGGLDDAPDRPEVLLDRAARRRALNVTATVLAPARSHCDRTVGRR